VHDATLLDPRDTCAERQSELRKWLRLHAAFCLAPQRGVAHLEAANGDPARALAESGELPLGDDAALARSIAELARVGVSVLPITSSLYPRRLAALEDAAPLLMVSGDATLLERPAVAVVGARAATRYGLGVAHELGLALATSGFVVVSGLARGIDAAAHRGALEAGGATIAVQACGPERVYPPEHRELHDRIRASGAVMTELPPGYPPRAPYFPLRNRLISGLSRLVIVVEARLKSGSLITARHAAVQGRDVMAVPGPLSAPTSEGPNRLIRDGATPMLEFQDVLDQLGVRSIPPTPTPTLPPPPPPPDRGRDPGRAAPPATRAR